MVGRTFGAGRISFPKESLFLASESCYQKFLQALDGCEHLIGTCEHPAAYLIYRNRRDKIHRNAFAMRHSQLGGGAAAVGIFRRPIADYVVRLVLYQIQIEGYDLAHGAAEAVEV